MALRSWLAAISVLFAATAGLAQPPRGDFGGRSSRGMMFGDPSQMLDRFFNGKDSIDLNEMQEPMRTIVQRFADMAGIKGDRITRQQMESGIKQMRDRFMGGLSPGNAPGGMPGGPSSFGRPGEFGDRFRERGDRDRERGDRMSESDAFAESIFRRSDRDNDGLLSADEMSESLRDERDKWDFNRDGFIELSEYRTYFAARMQQTMKEREEMRNERREGQEGEELERKPVLFRAGKLPKELPSWFAQLDANADAQVGLYEWKESKKPFTEFKQYDRNGDNFLTVEEVLLYVKLNKPSGGDSFSSANGSGDRRPFGMMPGPGMPGMTMTPGATPGTFTGRFSGGERPSFGSGDRSERGSDSPRFPSFGKDRSNGERSGGKSEKRDDKDSKREDRPSMPSFGKKKR